MAKAFEPQPVRLACSAIIAIVFDGLPVRHSASHIVPLHRILEVPRLPFHGHDKSSLEHTRYRVLQWIWLIDDSTSAYGLIDSLGMSEASG
jgi:hypothetical protein